MARLRRSRLSRLPPAPSGPILDLHCGDCRRAGDPNPPRLGSFALRPDGVFLWQWVASHEQVRDHWLDPRHWPREHQRPDGGVTWQLRCPHGHHRPIRHERIVAAFEHFPAGQDVARVDV